MLYFQWAHRCWSSEVLTGNFITFGLRLQKQKCSFMVLWVSYSYLGNMKLSKVHRDVDIVSSPCTFQSWIRFGACLWCVILSHWRSGVVSQDEWWSWKAHCIYLKDIDRFRTKIRPNRAEGIGFCCLCSTLISGFNKSKQDLRLWSKSKWVGEVPVVL